LQTSSCLCFCFVLLWYNMFMLQCVDTEHWNYFQWFLRDLTGMLGGILFTFYQVCFSNEIVVLINFELK
jgi:hypothetical protein